MSIALHEPTPIQEKALRQALGASDQVIYNRVFSILDTLAPPQGQLLDFGAGRGNFIKQLVGSAKYMLHAVDLMFSQVPTVNWYVQDLNKRLQFKDNQFEVITCLEVIEHLENPRQTLREMARILKPGGLMIVSTPNNESWRSIISYIIRGHFVSFTDSSYPAHITALNRKDLTRVLEEAQLMNIQFFYTNSGMVPTRPSWTWQKLSGGWLKGLRYSDNLIVIATK